MLSKNALTVGTRLRSPVHYSSNPLNKGRYDRVPRTKHPLGVPHLSLQCRAAPLAAYWIPSEFLRRPQRCPKRKATVVVHASTDGKANRGPRLPEKKPMNSGSILGAIALITGSTVGAGMLALPEATAGGGFLPSAGIMIVSWLILTSEALLMAEVNLSVREKRRKATGEDPDTVVTLKEMAEQTLGPIGGRLTSGLYLFLVNTLLVAYISKGGELLDLLSGHTMSASVASLVFTLGLGGLLWKGSEKTVDMTNRAFTSILLFLFGGLLLGGAQSAQFSTLLQQQDWTQEWSALPVVFLALVYHDLVPVLCKYLGWNKRKIRTALVCGSLVPLSLFLAWDAVALALVPGAVNVIEAGGAIDPIRVLIETQGDLAGSAIGIFSLLAVTTSFMGTTLGLSEYMKAELTKWFKKPKQQQQETVVGETEVEMDAKLLAMMMALTPPTLAAFSSPNLFFAATRIAVSLCAVGPILSDCPVPRGVME